MKEIWKDIPGYEGIYQASTLGRIRSLDRTKKQKNAIVKIKGFLLKSSVNHRGYLQVVLSKESKRKTFKVHQLVAITFLNHVPRGHETTVDHINNNKLDNRIENLQLLSNRENISKDKFRTNPKSKFIGVYQNNESKKWRAKIGINGKYVHLGTFKTEYEAHLAYQQKLKEINGQ